MAGGKYLLALYVFLEKWLLVLYEEGLVFLWDIGSVNPTPVQCACLDLGSTGWFSCAAALDAQDENIVLAASRMGHE
jgi:hypothetical protein